MDMTAIAAAVAARYAPGVIAAPDGYRPVVASTHLPPPNIPATPYVIVWPMSGDWEMGGSRATGTHDFTVCLYLAHRDASVPREAGAQLAWIGPMLEAVYGQFRLGLADVYRAHTVSWDTGTLSYGGQDYSGVTVTVRVWTGETVELAP